MTISKLCLVLMLAFASPAKADNSLDQYKGKWNGYSKAIYSVLGESLTISDNELIFEDERFEGKRKRSFKLINDSDGAFVIELSEPYDCGQFVRLGPIRKPGDIFSGFMEFSIFHSKEKALAHTDSCIWGLYSR
jgi:hypothetical protein